MCGRFPLRSPVAVIAQEFGLSQILELPPGYNIAPRQNIPVVRCRDGKRELAFLRWGLIPAWADDPAIGDRLANARSETAATKPSFKDAFRSRRCLIVTDGFYEWQRRNGKKQLYYVRLKQDRTFGMAGLWERWEKGGHPIETCTILTTDANDLVKPIHERMPVIIGHENYGAWLEPRFHDTLKLQEMLRPYPSEELVAYPVSTLVNNPENDVEKCVEPLESS